MTEEQIKQIEEAMKRILMTIWLPAAQKEATDVLKMLEGRKK